MIRKSMRRLSLGKSNHEKEVEDKTKEEVPVSCTEEESVTSYNLDYSCRSRSHGIPSSTPLTQLLESNAPTPVQKPRRRRSLLCSSAAVVDEEDFLTSSRKEDKETTSSIKPLSRRRSWFGQSEKEVGETEAESSALETKCVTSVKHESKKEPVEDSELARTPRKPLSRRRSWFGSGRDNGESNLEEKDDDVDLVPKKPDSLLRSLLTGASLREGSNRGGKQGKTPPKPKSRRRGSLTNTFSMSSRDSGDSFNSQQPPKPKSRRRPQHAGSWSFNHKSREPHKPKPRRSKSHRVSKPSNLTDHPEQPQRPASSRRCSMDGTITESSSDRPTPRRRHSIADNSSSAVTSESSRSTPNKPVTASVYDMVNRSRVKRGLSDYSRNMLMDTIAKQVAHDLAASAGRKCTPTNFHGNVGQGESVKAILKTMMVQKGTAKSNILNPNFSEFGVGMAVGRDGMIYMCQLFN